MDADCEFSVPALTFAPNSDLAQPSSMHVLREDSPELIATLPHICKDSSALPTDFTIVQQLLHAEMVTKAPNGGHHICALIAQRHLIL
jgi:hypothetical protein